jgi:adenine-specific DNA-methyltransferase
MTKSFNEKLIELLKKDSRFVDDEGELVKAAVIDRAWKIDRDLVKVLLGDSEIKRKFFEEIEDHWIFNINTFIEYIADKNFLADSYTRFRNKIGLNIDDKFLRERREVSLVWPYKDCVLEGGQTKEEEKRKEIFFNEILAQDEIDRLFDPKVLTKWKRHAVDGEQKVAEIKRDENGTIRENLIIKGNNLLALHTLKKQFRGKVKLIYIDPPYNTGNDEFGYNDNFNHSGWLTFLKNRIEIGKEFLAEGGAIFISIDDNEIGYALVLLDEVFGKDNFAGIVTVKRGSVTGHKAINPGVINICEYLVAYSKNKSSWCPNRVYKKRERNIRYNGFIKNREKHIYEWEFTSLLEAFSEFKNIPKNKLKKQLGDSFEDELFEFIVANAKAVVQLAYPDKDKVSKEARKLINNSKNNPRKVIHYSRDNNPDMYLIGGQRILFYSDRLIEDGGEIVTGESLSNLWDDVLPNDLHNEGGIKLKKGKKPEKLIQRILQLASNENDIILDFFVGSGTAASVAMKMKRRFIAIEQLDYIEELPKIRLINTIKGEKSGISKSVNWQGGGDFIYCELMKYNEAYMDKIQAANTSGELVELWKDIAENSFLNWYVNPEMPKEAVNDFIQIGKTENGLEKQKKLLAELLNKNQLYVNLSEIDDGDFNVSEEDKKLNQLFYGENA